MTTHSFKIDVTVTPEDGDALAPVSLDGGFTATSTSLRKSFDDDQRIITCVAMVANEIDAHGDLFLPSAVEMAAHGFLADYNVTKSIGKQHDDNAEIDADLIGSLYVENGFDFEGLEVPDFSWLVQLRINDDETWTEVKKSEATGLSIQGPASGWIVDDNVEKALAVQLEKSKAGDSEFDTPKRVFSKADPTNLDVVDAGANLRLLIYKKKDIMADTRETVTTEAIKAKTEAPAVETEATEPEPVAVAKSEGAPTEPAPAPEPVGDPVSDLIAKMQAAQAVDLGVLEQAYAQIGKALGKDPGAPAPAPAPAPVVTPAPAASDLEALIAKAIGPIKDELAKAKTEVEELRKAKVASSASGDPVEVEVEKSADPTPNNQFGTAFNGFFSK